MLPIALVTTMRSCLTAKTKHLYVYIHVHVCIVDQEVSICVEIKKKQTNKFKYIFIAKGWFTYMCTGSSMLLPFIRSYMYCAYTCNNVHFCSQFELVLLDVVVEPTALVGVASAGGQ